MLFVDRARLDAAVEAFKDMAKTASPPGHGPISTQKALSDSDVVARHLLAAVGILCSSGGDGVSVAPSDVEWIVGGLTADGVNIGRNGVVKYPRTPNA